VSALSIIVSGSSSGNGTFDLSDFSYLYFYTPSDLDYAKELIGQSLSTGYVFGDRPETGEGGEFNLSATTSSSAPSSNWYFTLVTANGYGDEMIVTSIMAVPEPASCTLLLAGLGLLAGVAMCKTSSLSA
jgi:hypothetical protein